MAGNIFFRTIGHRCDAMGLATHTRTVLFLFDCKTIEMASAQIRAQAASRRNVIPVD
jgi:hypothetical protein